MFFCFACRLLRGVCACVSAVVVVNGMWPAGVCCLLFVVGELLLGACRCVLMLVEFCCCVCLVMGLFVACWLLLLVACCMLFVVCPFVVRRLSLVVVRCVLFIVVCCLLLVIRCSS